MKRTAFSLLALAWLLGTACSDDVPSGMTVTVQKLNYDEGCFATLAGNAGGDKLTVELADVCDGTADPTLVAGTDVVRLVVGYGDLAFARSTVPPTPTASISLDGQSVALAGSVVKVRARRPVAHTVTLPPIPRVAEGMYVAVAVNDGFAREPIGPIPVTGPELSVHVQECEADAAAGVDAGMGDPCSLTAGVGVATVTVKASGSAAASAELFWLLDDVEQPGSVSVALSPQAKTPGQLRGTGRIPVPASPEARVWKVVARMGPYVSQPSDSITLKPPLPQVTLQQCAASQPCELAAAVGTVAVEVDMRGTGSVLGTLFSKIDGVVQPVPTPIQLEPAPNAVQRVKGTAFVAVPAARERALWEVLVSVQGVAGVSAPVTLRLPAIATAVSSCAAAPCQLSAKQSIVLTITAPFGIQVTQAHVTSVVGGAFSPMPLVVALDRPTPASQTISGSIALLVPDQPGETWTINTSVAGYAAPTVVISIGAAAPRP